MDEPASVVAGSANFEPLRIARHMLDLTALHDKIDRPPAHMEGVDRGAVSFRA